MSLEMNPRVLSEKYPQSNFFRDMHSMRDQAMIATAFPKKSSQLSGDIQLLTVAILMQTAGRLEAGLCKFFPK